MKKSNIYCLVEISSGFLQDEIRHFKMAIPESNFIFFGSSIYVCIQNQYREGLGWEGERHTLMLLTLTSVKITVFPNKHE